MTPRCVGACGEQRRAGKLSTGSEVHRGYQRPVIGSGSVGAGGGVVLDRVRWRSSGSARGDLSVGDMVGDQVTDEDVIDELGVAAVDAGIAIFGGLDACGVPEVGPG